MATAPTEEEELSARRIWDSIIEKVVPADLESRSRRMPWAPPDGECAEHVAFVWCTLMYACGVGL